MYFVPNPTKNMPKADKVVSEELYQKIRKKQFDNLGPESTVWIYLYDCLTRGTITPMEAYDCLKIGYVPEYLGNRESYYQQY